MSEPWWSPDTKHISKCCEALSEDELDYSHKPLIGKCGHCHEMAEFEEVNEEDEWRQSKNTLS